MSYRHNFGSFQETVRVDGVTYTSTAYQQLSHADRASLREEAVSRCTAANHRQGIEQAKLMRPLEVAHKAACKALQEHPRFAKRYRGRAADMGRETRYLRDEFRREQRAVCDALTPVDGNTYPAAVGDVFRTWEMACETPREQFERLVTHHDWYFEYSDVHSVWSAGTHRRMQIMTLLRELNEGPDGEAAQLLYNQKCPWLNEDGTRKEVNR